MRRSLAALPLLLLAIAAQGERDPTDVIAVVLGEEITVADVAEPSIEGLINGLLIDRFMADNGIEATDEEIAAFADRMEAAGRQRLLGFEANRAQLTEALDGAIDPERRRRIQDRLEAVERRIEAMSESQQTDLEFWRPRLTPLLEGWKLDKALFDRYGGRARYRQVGLQPFDAMIRFLEEQEASGAFTILDKRYEDEFWAFWRSDEHSFIPEEEAAEFWAKPWWLMDEPTDD